MARSPLRIIPLGGLGEIGKNMLALEYDKDILVIDSGVLFPEEDMLGVDLVIMGSHGKMAGDEVVMGSTAERVVRRAPCPVLVIKPQDFRFEIPEGLKE